MKNNNLKQKRSLWIKKTSSKFWVCILTVLMNITLAIGYYHQFQESPSQQQAEKVLSAICGVEKSLREYNEGKTVKYEHALKGRFPS